MTRKITNLIIWMLVLCYNGFSQSKAISSAILNFGSTACGNTSQVQFTLIGKPLTAPYKMADCDINPPFSDVFSRFISYNPKDNKVYINDIRNSDSRLYVYDMGLPLDYSCPALMPLVPTYNYLYIPNNFEFDINGDVWSIRNLSGDSALIEKIDEATGTILLTKKLVFPTGMAPNTLGDGDIVLIPNGRMFIVVGNSPGNFYEITNYASTLGNATANFIQAMPKPCYGILYLNGKIQLCGTDFSKCYSYVYDIPSGVMGAEQPFQLGLMPIDNSSISPSVGVSKRLLGSTNVNANTEDIIYEVYAKNIGNVRMANFNITDDLAAVFGSGNVSAVSASIIPGANPSNLVLNPAYDGVSNLKVFLDNQVLSNLANGYVGIRILLRATNLVNNTIYNNTAFALGEIGKLGSRIPVIDSSNNGTILAIDPNADGDAGDVNENKPTPYYFGSILPITFIQVNAVRVNKNMHSIKWAIAPPPIPVSKFEVEYSEDHITWKVAGTVTGDPEKNNFYFNCNTFSNTTIYYRVKAYDNPGKNYISTEVVINKVEEGTDIKVSPNPADGLINVYVPDENFSANRKLYIVDVSGKKVFEYPFLKKMMDINTSMLPNGTYMVNVSDIGNVISTQVFINHSK